MVFSTILFLFRFLPITLALYYLAPAKLKNLALFVCSLVFYSWGEVKFFPVMVVLILINYFSGLAMEKFDQNPKMRRLFLIVSIVGSLSMLVFFKYTNFLIGTVNSLFGLSIGLIEAATVLPLGISFYTFQTMSYSIDVYRRDVNAEHNIIDFGAYVVMFPQLIAGPIVRYNTVARQLEERRESLAAFGSGAGIFAVGLAKKVLLANNIGMFWDAVKAMAPADMTVTAAWCGIVAFGLQLYFDFAGYSDMAIGLGRMLGFEFLPNFNYPYISKSITEFWRRWHISLSTWFKEYVYIPLGGNRCSKGRRMFNLLVVWAATGIWHGASWNYLIWGLYFFVLLMIEKFFLLNLLKKAPALVGHIYTLFFVLISWAIFGLENFTQLTAYLKVMFGLGGVPLMNGELGYYLSSYLPILCAAAVASTPLGVSLYRRGGLRVQQVACTVLVIAGLVVCTAYLVDGTYNPFLYWNF